MAILDNVKKVVSYAVVPLVLLVGVIYYLVNKVAGLRFDLSTAKAEKDLAVTLAKKEDAKNEADVAENKYIDALNKYKHDSES